MYILKAEASFDSAHFLKDYRGKCGNIHGHRWRIVVGVKDDKLVGEEDLQNRGFVFDFGKLKSDIKNIADSLDHKFIIEQGSMDKTTLHTLETFYGFEIVECQFRPTAENFAEFIYNIMKKKYKMDFVEVYETPNNVATYRE
jgi:6-pyruvoyltetrahydropterin/6-carboxytetrahydropterin synthase